MILALALAAAPNPFPLPKTPTAVLRVSCRQGECHWQQIRRIERVEGSGVLRKLTSRVGISTHLDDRVPARYSPQVEVEWEKAPKIEYVRCSKQRPMTIFWSTDSNEFVVTRLGFGRLAGYEYAAATLYMFVCHNIAPERWSEEAAVKMGYAGRGKQERFKTLAEALR